MATTATTAAKTTAKTALLTEAAKAESKYDKFEKDKGHDDNKEERDKVDSMLDTEDNPGVKMLILFLDKISKIIIVSFFVLACLICGAGVLGLVDLFLPGFVWFVIMLVLTCFGSLLGAFGTYKYGALEEIIDRFGEENDKYKTEINQLNLQTMDIGKENNKLHATVSSLKKDDKALQETSAQYDDLRKSLKKLCDDNGEMKEVENMLNDINNGYDDMQEMIRNNERAAILSIYYDAEFNQDGQAGLSSEEYDRVLGRLTVPQRKIFKALGSFKELSGNDNTIDLQEFQNMVNKVLEKSEENWVMQQSKSNKK